MTCNFDVICPALNDFEAKEIRSAGFSFPETLNVANEAACASRA
uniref:Clathrin heavy chain 1-like n=1 Tax=Rhizophora mucronata TaxID=61149 RepID=A0A2P2MB21_RHIMU